MSNGVRNCALGVCCPTASDEQKKALLAELHHDLDLGSDKDHPVVERVVGWFADEFDLAPHGSLVQLKAEVAKLARETQA